MDVRSLRSSSVQVVPENFRKRRELIHRPLANRRVQRLAFNSTICERSEEHTSELQSRLHLVCRLLLEKNNELLEAPRGCTLDLHKFAYSGPVLALTVP